MAAGEEALELWKIVVVFPALFPDSGSEKSLQQKTTITRKQPKFPDHDSIQWDLPTRMDTDISLQYRTFAFLTQTLIFLPQPHAFISSLLKLLTHAHAHSVNSTSVKPSLGIIKTILTF